MFFEKPQNGLLDPTNVVRLDNDNPLYTAGGDCQRPAPEAPIPVYQLFEAEVKLALGEAGYAELEAGARE